MDMSSAALTIKPYAKFADLEPEPSAPESKKRKVEVSVEEESAPAEEQSGTEEADRSETEHHWLLLLAGALSGVAGFVLVRALLK